ncbi:MAG: hypothetical protein OEV99_07300 [Nitrospira sp.]|nr:hypothetical protein [Nitrospira sp.]MDH5193171.1 hypothetical protein [Nitrospira sp.]
MAAGTQLSFCPRDKADLVTQAYAVNETQYTQEETQIIGTIQSASRGDRVFARQIADDVGCYVQKVSKFGEQLGRTGLAKRHHPVALMKLGSHLAYCPNFRSPLLVNHVETRISSWLQV